MEKDFLWYVKLILLVIWQLPQALVGGIMYIFLRNKTRVADGNFSWCWSADNMYGGISLGPFCFVSDYMKEPQIRHELFGHTVDSKRLGPLYLVVIGLPSLLNAIFRFTKCYYEFYTERWANKHAGLSVDSYCRLIIKK